MAETTRPESKADVDPNLHAQVKELQKQQAANAEARANGNAGKWLMPKLGEWDGDLFDWEGMAEPFDRSASNDAFAEAVNPASPGTTGDVVVIGLQVDLLATMERAFRSRHLMSRPRAAALAAGREAGHGHDAGPLVQSLLEHVRQIVKESKGG